MNPILTHQYLIVFNVDGIATHTRPVEIGPRAKDVESLMKMLKAFGIIHDFTFGVMYV